jgi:prophage antirepressor-like protein
MPGIVAYTFDTSEIRTITNDQGEPWFVLRDILAAMGTSTTVTAAVDAVNQGLGKGLVVDIPLQTPGGEQQAVIVAEAAVTYLVARSNTEAGRKLNRFIHTEVLPEIRKTGGYQQRPMSPAEVLIHQGQMMLAIEQEQARQALQIADNARRLDQIETASDHFTILGWHRYAKLEGSLPLAEAAAMGKIATRFCKDHEIAMGEVPDPRFGKVKTYPKWALDELFVGPAN